MGKSPTEETRRTGRGVAITLGTALWLVVIACAAPLKIATGKTTVATAKTNEHTFSTVLSLILPLIGVMIGFGLTVGWDYWKTSREQQTQLINAARSVDHETQNNISIISTDLSTLRSDDIAADSNNEVVTPPIMPLMTSAIETAYRNGSFEISFRDLAIGIGDVYTTDYLINRRIEGHDFYRYTNQAFNNYARRRKMLNAELEGIFGEQQRRLSGLHLVMIKIINKRSSTGREDFCGLPLSPVFPLS
jgi:hypothetical protein